jgi:hypothetical protein
MTHVRIRKIAITPADDEGDSTKHQGLIEVQFDSDARPDDNVPAKAFEIKYYFANNKDIFSQDNHKLDITFSYLESGKTLYGSLKSDDDFVLFRQALPQRLENVNIKSILNALWYLDFENVN